MALSAGTRFGPYEIQAVIGAGGMGEVYRARDTKLRREVALKILPDSVATDPDRLARFQREAEVLASLNHPHIAAIYGFEESNSAPALVLELVEGATLADRIAQAPIPLDETLAIARQMADALEAAHGRDIIHRDLKPANIKLRPDGTVKVLDFGLAKALEPVPARTDATQSPTITSPAMTRLGVILGTAAYMSPEQAKGRAADKRSDIWAFGCVLFEMLSGRSAFGGEDVSDTFAFILTREPDWTLLPPDTPLSVRRLLRRCLEKGRPRRLADIADARLELDEGVTDGAASAATPALRSPTLFRHWLPWSIAATSLATTVWLAGTAVRDRPAADTLVYRSSIPLPGRLRSTAGANVALSPDGRRVALVIYDPAGRSQLWMRSLDGLAARPLEGTDDGRSPFWSPDSRWLAFVADGKLKKIEASGGTAVTLCDSAVAGGTWNRDDVILFTQTTPWSLAQVRATGGTPSVLTTLDAKAGEWSHVSPVFLPDNRHFVYVALGGFSGEEGSVYVASLDSAQRTRLPVDVDATMLQYAEGFLWFTRRNTLMAQPFDADGRRLGGEALPVAEQVRVGHVAPSRSFFSVSPAAMVFQGDPSPGYELTWFDREGRATGTLGTAADYADLTLSPDSRRALVSVGEPGTTNRDLWIFDVPRGLRTRFTFDGAREMHSIWSPDGAQVVFDSKRTGHFDLFQKSSSGAGGEEVLLTDGSEKNPFSWSPDGRFILFHRLKDLIPSLWLLPLQGDRKPFPFRESFVRGGAQFSPDGRWIAYSSNESGRVEVYITPFPGPGGKWLVSTSGGIDPRWRRDGKEIFYLGPIDKLWAAAITADRDHVDVAEARPLFDLPKVGPRFTYDVSSDGRRILAVTRRAEAASAPLTLVVNWPATLKH